MADTAPDADTSGHAGAASSPDAPVARLVAKLEQRDRLSAEEKAALAGAVARTRRVPAGEDLVREGSRPAESTLLLEGVAARYKMLREGARQIVAMHVPGDFVDLHAFLLRTLDHSAMALAPCLVATVPHEALRAITEAHPHLSRLLWLNTLVDGAICREWLAAMGRRPALGQVAHFLCEMFLRLQAVGLAQEGPGATYGFRLPVTQTDLADVLGLSTVHVNRMVQELRREGLVTWARGVVAIADWDGLRRVAEFDANYLHLRRERR